MKAKRIPTFALIVFLLCATGCSVRIVNKTPPGFSPSTDGFYKIKAGIETNRKDVVQESFEAFVVIDGEQRPMLRNYDSSDNLFEYDYQPDPNKSLVRFYYVLNYLTEHKNKAPALQQMISGLYQFQLANAMVLKLDKQRAAVGTTVTLYGEQFTDQDYVLIDGISCKTTFISPNELQFQVPDMSPSFNYIVDVFTAKGIFNAGKLRVDAANPLRVVPEKLELKTSQPKAIAFMLEKPAPYGGLYIDVSTDIPDCIVMPELLVPEGARTFSTAIEGKHISNGNLFINVDGLPEIVVPVTVR